MKGIITIALAGMVLAGCNAETARNFPGEPAPASIKSTASGLKYIDMTMGTGESPAAGSRVTVHYSGYLLNGKKFDSSVDRDEPLVFTVGVGQVIKGWDEGLSTMKVGGKRKLIIPSHLGYGARGAGDAIPPDADLVFDVELLKAE